VLGAGSVLWAGRIVGARTWGVPWEGIGSGGDAKRRGGGRVRSRVRTEMPVARLGQSNR
jgi:hypothetical protein